MIYFYKKDYICYMGNALDDRHEIYQPYSSQCGNCKLFNIDGYCCPAFPDGIPDKLLTGERKHDSIVEGQKEEHVYNPEFNASWL